ncbi:MAG: sigma 54-interacting transcriptional regulator, partial [bacterium]
MPSSLDILIIDDEIYQCETLKDLLEDEGYTVATATDGNTGLEFLDGNRCLVAIIDIMLPDTSGLDILKIIKHKGIDCLPIMLTAFATLETSINALNEGAYAYIVKPYKVDEVKATVRNAIEKQRLAHENRELLQNLKKANKNLTRVTRELEELNRDLEDKVFERTRELAEAKDKMAKIMSSIAEGIISLDKEFRITSFNRAAEQITGINRAEALNRHCWEVFRASICEQRCALRETMETGRPLVNQSIFIVNVEGDRVPVSISTALLRDKNGEIIGGVETFRDLSVVEELRKELAGSHTFLDIISKNREMRALFAMLEQIADSNASVLLEGESGTGKELFAKAIHSLSPRRNGPMITVNCAALPDSLLESELFGYKAGAFTDA